MGMRLDELANSSFLLGGEIGRRFEDEWKRGGANKFSRFL
jgi:hypothetical protein